MRCGDHLFNFLLRVLANGFGDLHAAALNDHLGALEVGGYGARVKASTCMTRGAEL